MWDEIKDKPTNVIKRNIRTIKNLKELFSPSKNNLLELFDHGYQDAKKHKEYLDLLFVSKDFENTVHDKNDGVIEI
jgi:hypothetical protein